MQAKQIALALDRTTFASFLNTPRIMKRTAIRITAILKAFFLFAVICYFLFSSVVMAFLYMAYVFAPETEAMIFPVLSTNTVVGYPRTP